MNAPAPNSTRARLAAEIAEKTGVSRREAEIVVGLVFRSIADALAAGEEVEIRGFGSFRLRRRAARHTRNPRTGEPVLAPPRQVPFFRTGKKLRDAINADPVSPDPAAGDAAAGDAAAGDPAAGDPAAGDAPTGDADPSEPPPGDGS